MSISPRRPRFSRVIAVIAGRDPPVQQLGDVEHVLRRTRDLVDPAELLQLLAGPAEHAEHLAVEAQLVDAAGKGVRAVEHLVAAAA